MNRNAQLSTKIVFWQNTVDGEIKMGLPEQYPAPAFHSKIVCHTAYEAELWSGKMRQQERAKTQMEADKRDPVEEEIRSRNRSEIYNCMVNAKNSVDREFARRYLEKTKDKPSDPTEWLRQSYLHAEAFEKGH